jgi:hypothetical protein
VTGQLIAWVKVPSINNGTVLYLHYSDLGVGNTQNPTGVWDANYKAVWHLKEPTGNPAIDSTSNPNDGTPENSPTQTAGQIDGSLAYANANDSNVRVLDNASLRLVNTMTLSGWAKAGWTGGDINPGLIVAKWKTPARAELLAGKFDAALIVSRERGEAVSGPDDIDGGAWHYVVGVADAAGLTGLKLYVDGALQNTANYTGTSQTGFSNLMIGNSPDSLGCPPGPGCEQDWNGGLDEVRVSDTPRSAGWIATEYRNQSSPSTFYSLCDCASPLAVTEGAGTLTVTDPSNFELVFSTAMGGGVQEFYDLAESSTRDAVHDLAGGVGGDSFSLWDEYFFLVPPEVRDGSDATAPRLDLLEATGTRVRVRQEASYQEIGAATVLPGPKAVRDVSVYPSGRAALRWNRRMTSQVDYLGHDMELWAHYQSSGTLSNWSAYSESGVFGTGSDDFVLQQIEETGARTDFLFIMDRDWEAGSYHLATADSTQAAVHGTDEYANAWWDEGDGDSILAGSGPYSQQAGETWNFLTYFKPTNFADNTDPAVTSRRDDYRSRTGCPTCGPDPLAFSAGSGWNENTADADFFNESEAAYTLNLDPSAGLTFTMDGGTTPRYKPFFKIRQWRSLGPPATATLNGVTLNRDVHFKADVKPVSRAYFARALAWHSTLQDGDAVISPDVGSTGTVNGASFTAGRYGDAALFTAGANVTFGSGSGNFDKTRGAEFWYRRKIRTLTR